MMAQRSLLRPDKLDSHGSYNFAQLTIDGYSGGSLQDGYLMGLVLTDGYVGGSETLRIDAHDGAINQVGSGQVTFNGSVHAVQDVIIDGDLTVQGTTTTIDTEQMVVTDPITVINASGSEASSDWTGFTARDADGYNRIGWSFDGYWAISSAAVGVTQPDAVPDRALAFLADGYTNGDLSSTDDNDSGADKIGVTAIAGVSGDNVQVVLESLDSAIDTNASNIATNASNIATNASNIATNASNIATNTSNIAINASNIATNTANISALEEGTTYNQWTINTDASATDEDACLIMSGGDGASIIDGYFCVITDSVGGDRFQLQLYEGGSKQTTDLHLGTASDVTSADATLTFNAGNGVDAYQASISLDGNGSEQGELVYTSSMHEFSGDVQLLNDFELVGNVVSDLDPTDCTYQLGDETHKWLDGYFCLFSPTNYTPIGSNYSLEGHLKGIDNALTGGGVALKPERGVYVITPAESLVNELDSSRAIDQGVVVDVGSWTDNDFRDYAWIYWNGQLLYNDPTSAADQGSVANDIARKTGSLSTVIFAGNLRRDAVIQIIDMR